MSNARLAGLFYLIVVVTGLFSLAYVPSRIAVAGDSAATVANILAMEPLFRAGIAASILCYLAFLLLPLPLYRLLEPAGPVAARLMVLFAVVSVPMALLNLGHDMDVLAALRLGDSEEAAAHLAASRNGQIFVQLFWGLWLLPLGLLIVRSAAIPRVLGALLMFGCLGYCIKVFGLILVPDFAAMPGIRYVSIPGSVGEIGTCLWLLVMGARPPSAPQGD
ncbi:MAG: DUF4386 domain-containing protein [Prosthecobacter sp.]|nr:DUF4386 domain-containing protein [Prosthecobacter sp.]